MFRIPARLSRPVVVGVLVVSVTAAAAVAGTIHAFTLSQTTGSVGAIDILQTTVPGGALQGEVGSAASTGLGTSFGMFGKYGPPSGTTAKGIGVVGISTLGWGVVGDNIGGGPALYAFPNKNDGVGLDAESDNKEAIYGEAHGTGIEDGADIYADGVGYGVYGYSSKNYGMEGEGATSDGVDGIADTSGDGTYGQSITGYGVEGYSVSNDGVHAEIQNGNSGVAGLNDGSGNGVYGRSVDGAGLSASSLATPGPAPTGGIYQYAATYSKSASGPGLYGVDVHNSGAVAFGPAYDRYAGVFGYGYDGAGVVGYYANDFGILAENNDEFPTLVVEHDGSGAHDEILAGSGGTGSGSPTGFNFDVDTSGDVYAGGTVTSGDGSFAVTRNPHADTVTYGAEATEPMVEDVGSAHLTNGTASVALAADFRQTIQDAAHYMVFLTPYGDTRGLYVASRTPAGFVVREAQGGRSTMDFDYRIVAQRYGVQTGRLPHLATLSPHMAELRLAALHPNAGTPAVASALRYGFATPVKEGSNHPAQARFAAGAAHRRMTRPPAPPPGFLAGAGLHN